MKLKLLKQAAYVLSFVLIVSSAVPASAPVEAAKKMTLNTAAKTLYVGEKGIDFDVKYMPKGAVSKWTVSDSNIASIDSKTGITLPKKNGKVTVKCTVTAKRKTLAVLKAKVTVRTKASSVKILRLPTSIEAGKSVQLAAEISPDTASNKNVKWYVDNDSNAKINLKTGQLTGITAGEKVKIACVPDSNKAKAKSTAYIEVVAAPPKAKQIGARTIQVDLSDKLVKDITVKKGTSVIPLAAVNPVALSEDGKSAIVRTAENMSSGGYTVEIKDVKANASFTAQEPKNVKLSIDNEHLVLNGDVGSPDTDKAYAYYRIENQWGEDTGSRTTISSISSAGSSTAWNGRVEVSLNTASQIIGSKSNMLLVDERTGLTASASLTLSTKSVVSGVSAEGIYNPNGKKLAVDSDLDKEDFYFVINITDQYGNKMLDKNAVRDGILVNIQSPNMLEFNKEQSSDKLIYENIIINEEKRLALKIVKPYLSKEFMTGKTRVDFITLGAGKKASAEIEILEKVNFVDSITFKQPKTAVVNEEVEIPFTAVNTYGSPVTDYDALKNVTLTPSSFKVVKNYSTDKAKIVLTKDGNQTSGQITLTALTKTMKHTNLTFQVKESVFPSVVTGILSGTKAAVLSAQVDSPNGTVSGGILEYKLTDFSIRDTSGRSMTADQKTSFFRRKNDSYKIGMDLSKYSSSSEILHPNPGDPLVGNLSAIYDLTGNSEKIQLQFLNQSENDIKTYEIPIGLYKKNSDDAWILEADSDYVLNITIAKPNIKYASYKINTPTNIYAVSATASQAGITEYSNDFEVIGVTDKRKEILLSPSEYLLAYDNKDVPVTDEANKYLIVDEITKGKNSIYAFNQSGIFKESKTDEMKKVTVSAVIYSDGKKVEKSITICEKAPEIRTYAFKTDKEYVFTSLDIKPKAVKSGSLFVLNLSPGDVITIASLKSIMDIKDQYGKELVTTDEVAAMRKVKNSANLSGNTTKDALYLLESEEEVEVSILLSGGKTAKILVITD